MNGIREFTFCIIPDNVTCSIAAMNIVGERERERERERDLTHLTPISDVHGASRGGCVAGEGHLTLEVK